MKRVLSIQDISCVGRCSLTVALPVLSAMGVEACPLPTALLSTHTAFKHFHIKDLTDEIEPIENVWDKEGLTFDVVESGYLGSIRQIDIVRAIGSKYRNVNGQPQPGFLQIVDPAMADHGKLYAGFDAEFVEAMAGLCKDADFILPNITEACLMSGMEYRPDADGSYWDEVTDALADMGCRGIILTGYSPDKDHIGALSLQVRDGRRIRRSYVSEKLDETFHGTGDIFAAVVTGAMARGAGLENAVKLAVDFTLECMHKTQADPGHKTYGVNFEQALFMLTKWQRDMEDESI